MPFHPDPEMTRFCKSMSMESVPPWSWITTVPVELPKTIPVPLDPWKMTDPVAEVSPEYPLDWAIFGVFTYPAEVLPAIPKEVPRTSK